ncbi:hypothetical protein BC829DRAFT_245741 [Chytridium lagenaria]|nr:hypothetical protein BC829DRAFT_245741 [Chytridium lagenaria]
MASTSSSHTRRKVMLPSHLAGYAPVVNIVTDLVQQSSDTCDDDGRSTSALSSFVNLNGMQDNRIVEAKVAAITIEAEPPPILVPPIHAELPRLFQDPPTGITRRVTVDVVEDSSSSRNNRYLLNPLGGVKSPPTGLNLSPDQLGASNSNLGAGLKNSLNPGSILSFNSSLRSNTIAHGSMLSIFSSGVEPQADAVVSIMHKLGESEWLPLLNFLPWFLHEENETTKYLNQTARANCIALLIARLIDKVAARLRIVIMLDNAQWLDSFSLETLLALVKIGQQPFIIVFTRPTTDVHVSQVFHKVSDIPSTTSLVIRGLTEIDVEEMIKQQYGASITSVDPVITKTIFKKCGGHPFFSLQLIQALKDFGKDHIAVTAKRRLAIVSKNLDLDHLLVNDVQTAIMAQFDRLNPDFQRILKAASIMGQYFDLEDLAGFLMMGGISTLNIWRISLSRMISIAFWRK